MYHKEIDVAAIMRDIRKKADVQDSLGLGELYEKNGFEKVREMSQILSESRQWIDEKRSEAKPFLEMGMRIPAFNMIRPVFRKACVFIARLIRKATLHITREQTVVNRRMDECIAELAKSDQVMMKGIIEMMESNIRRIESNIEKNSKKMESNIESLKWQVAAVDKNQISDELYLQFENNFRGSSDDIKWRMKNYIAPYFDKHIANKETANIVDLGCGRGEWLSVLQESGYNPIGVDNNKAMIEHCKERGFRVQESDAVYYLKQQPDHSLQAITLFQVVEHLPTEAIVAIFNESQRVLVKGGFILMETPNAHNVEVGTINFYIDPTHVRPLHMEYLRFLADISGFKRNEIFYWKDKEIENWYKTLLPNGDIQQVDSTLVRQLAETMRKNFYSSPDYALISFKE